MDSKTASPWDAAGLMVGAVLLIGIAGAMCYGATRVALPDAILLGIGAAVMAGFALSRQWWVSQVPRPPLLPWLGFFGTWKLIYPLGAVLLARFLLLPAELWIAAIGVTAGVIFLLPVLIVLFHVLSNVNV